MMRPVRRIILLSALAALLVPASAVALDRTVSVQATVERAVPNDAAEVHFSVSKERSGRAAALHVVAVRLRAVIAAAQAAPGVGPGDVTTGSITVRRVEKGERPVYRASEGVTVVTHQPEEAGSLVTAGVAAGATSTSGPSFFASDGEAAYDAALVEALQRAKAKADMLAVAAGATLGPALTITESGAVRHFEGASAAEPVSKCAPVAPVAEGSPGTRRAGGRASACAAPPPVKPGNSTVTASVDATFALQ
jgi:uncharacterized protein YggE